MKNWGGPGIFLAILLVSTAAFAQRPSFNSDETYNLGALGAKGVPVTREEVPQLGKGMVGYRVEKLLELSPARDAGLLVRDIILSVDGKGFKKKPDPLLALVGGLEKAISKKSGTAVLMVLREGRGKKITVPLGHLPAHARTCPAGCERCKAVAEKAITYLVKTQQPDGSWGRTTGAMNGQVAVASLAGLVLLASGSTPQAGPHAGHVKRAVDFVVRTCSSRARDPWAGRTGMKGSMNQENWKWGYAGFFLSEAYKKSPDPKLLTAVQAGCSKILQNQEATGGWAHGPGGPNPLGYLELEIVSNYVLTALGCGRQLGLEIDGAPVKKALDYIIATGPGDGGVGYSTRSGQKGHGEPGRTSGAIVAFITLGFRRHPFISRMSKYLLTNMRHLPSGHVSPMMHLWFGSLACHNLGSKHIKKYWKEFRLVFMAARRPDGAFDSWPTQETIQLHSNSDRQMGLAWSTASLALPLLLHRGHLELMVPGKK